MSCIHYKFKSSLDYNSVTFDGMHLSLADLKKLISLQKRLKPGEFDLEITNAQTGDGKCMFLYFLFEIVQ